MLIDRVPLSISRCWGLGGGPPPGFWPRIAKPNSTATTRFGCDLRPEAGCEGWVRLDVLAGLALDALARRAPGVLHRLACPVLVDDQPRRAGDAGTTAHLGPRLPGLRPCDRGPGSNRLRRPRPSRRELREPDLAEEGAAAADRNRGRLPASPGRVACASEREAQSPAVGAPAASHRPPLCTGLIVPGWPVPACSAASRGSASPTTSTPPGCCR